MHFIYVLSIFIIQVFIVMFAFNWVIADVFTLKNITFWQAALLFIAIKLLLPNKVKINNENANYN